MTDTNDKLATNTKDLFKPRKFGIGARKEQVATLLQSLDPKKVPNRLGIIFDDSGSMSTMEFDEQTQTYSTISAITNAKTGVSSFLTNCEPDKTSIAICPLNKEMRELTCDYSLANAYVSGLAPTGSTPLYTKILEVLTLPITRGVIFSDGDATDNTAFAYDRREDVSAGIKDKAISAAIERKVPLDTIFIGVENSNGFQTLKEIAEKTGGIFIHFTSSSTLSTSLKYLSPGLRQLLLNADNKAKIEKGQTI